MLCSALRCDCRGRRTDALVEAAAWAVGGIGPSGRHCVAALVVIYSFGEAKPARGWSREGIRTGEVVQPWQAFELQPWPCPMTYSSFAARASPRQDEEFHLQVHLF